jgi:hypothetical protein
MNKKKSWLLFIIIDLVVVLTSWHVSLISHSVTDSESDFIQNILPSYSGTKLYLYLLFLNDFRFLIIPIVAIISSFVLVRVLHHIKHTQKYMLLNAVLLVAIGFIISVFQLLISPIALYTVEFTQSMIVIGLIHAIIIIVQARSDKKVQNLDEEETQIT